MQALRHCPFELEVWKQLNFAWDQGNDITVETEDWIKQKCAMLDQNQLQQLAVTTCTIWSNGNGELHGDERKTPVIAANFVCNYITEFNQAQNQERGGMQTSQQRWIPPEPGLCESTLMKL